ncbi:MAG: DUF4175 domain-containing protein [Saprospiraceae bacterium]|nr:DUF4175 domain-containing protein [Saprospiraceae bacterium]
MVNNKSNYEQLIEKLDQFTRKYYINQLIKGCLYSIALILVLFLTFNLLEYNFYFSTTIRKVLFYSFFGVTLGVIFAYVITPLTKYFRLGQVISHEESANIIGSHFSDVKDKLLNILQLKKQESTHANLALLEASIDQKTNAISLVPFKSAIDLNANRKYLKYALPPFMLLLILLFAAPSIIKDSTKRILDNNTEYVKDAPFAFNIENQILEVVQFQDFTLNIQTNGSILPDEVFVTIDDFQYKMQKNSKTDFSYTFRNVQKDVEFKLQSGKVVSVAKKLKVLEKPNLADFNLELIFPSYTGRTNEILQNIGDVVVPEGTKITWLFNALKTDKLSIVFGDNKDETEAERKAETRFRYTRKAMNDEIYKLFLSNKQVPGADSLLYSINVIKDQFPSINAEKIIDSLDNTLVYFIGNASDDYGLNTLAFNYIITKENGKENAIQTSKLQKQNGREIQFDHVMDLKKLNLEPGDKISFYFEVFDNDGVNGSKSSKTSMMTYAKPSLKELKEIEEKNDEAIQDQLKESLLNLEKLQDNFKKMKEKLLQQKQLDWQDKKEMERLLEEQKKIQEQLEKAKEKLDENIKNQQELTPQSEEIEKKQDKIEELLEKTLNPEMKELMDKIKDLLQELDKEDAVQMLEQFDQNNETLEKDMERMLELYKQLEMEKQMSEQIKELEKLAEKQEKLSDKTEQNQESKEELKKEQAEIEKKLDEIKEKQKELEEKNKELSPPKDLGKDNEEKMDDISKDMDQSQKQMDKSDSKGAAKSQKKAAKKMKEMAYSMKQSMEGGAQEQAQEDIKTLRQLLENLVTLSFEQEDLVNKVQSIQPNTPSYVQSIQHQFKLKNDFRLIEDTLVALSNRNPDIATFVMDKVAEIKINMKESISELEERKVPQGIEKQRRTMKNVNDLALMLDESLENAQKQMASGMPGSQMCKKPGGKGDGKDGKKPMNKITEGQQGLGEELQKMKEKMGKGEGGSAKDYAQAAAKQAALRKALQELQDGKKEQGQGSKELEEILNNMDKIETELVNKRLNAETLKRMKDIETRLLEAERAERQRELDNKRKSETADEKRRELPPSLQEYLKKRQAEVEMYKSVSPSLRPYYKSLVDEYYKALKSVR